MFWKIKFNNHTKKVPENLGIILAKVSGYHFDPLKVLSDTGERRVAFSRLETRLHVN